MYEPDSHDELMAAAYAGNGCLSCLATTHTIKDCPYEQGGRLNDDPADPADWLPLELCTGLTPQCPHYTCPDGWHAGWAPNCSCTPDCALEDDK